MNGLNLFSLTIFCQLCRLIGLYVCIFDYVLIVSCDVLTTYNLNLLAAAAEGLPLPSVSIDTIGECGTESWKLSGRSCFPSAKQSMHDGCRCGDNPPVILSTFGVLGFIFTTFSGCWRLLWRSDIEMACISAMKKVSPILDTSVFLVLCCAYYIDVPKYFCF
jgi:hypothetical protein